MNYRADIDGLRAIAVLAVFVYHLGASWLPGGFIGVDVFFVISGFLITGIIRASISNQSFSFMSFFTGRIRRIAPALLCMTLIVVLVGSIILKPVDLVALHASAWTQPFAIQNFFFLLDGEYFNGSDRKPLLHTWSLGVEEQFYLVWPLLIVLAIRKSRSCLLVIILGVIVSSFVLNLFLIPHSPKASFFMFPARAWELAAGGLLAVCLEKSVFVVKFAVLRTVIASTGLCFLVIGFLVISKAVVYPGWYALLPVAGTLCLLWTSEKTWISSILGLAPFVYIGKISYSLYLWHWPTIVFARILNFDMGSPATILAVVAITTFLSILSYQLIEQPIRKKIAFRNSRPLYSSFTAVAIGLCFLSLASTKTQGFSSRYSEPARSMLTASFNTSGDSRCGIVFRLLNPSEMICRTSEPMNPGAGSGVLLWGNSHAAMWLGVVNELGLKYDKPVYLNSRNCRPTRDYAFCGEHVQKQILRSIEESKISDVILANTWYDAYGIDDSVFETELIALVENLTKLDVVVWLVLDVPSSDKFHPVIQYEESPENPYIGSIPYSDFEETFVRENVLFSDIKERFSNVMILDPTDELCLQQVRCVGGAGSSVWYRDTNHLTTVGANTAKEEFELVFVKDGKSAP